MPAVKYVGPFDAVEVPALGRVVERDESVDVSSDVAKSLTEQSDNWVPAKKSNDNTKES